MTQRMQARLRGALVLLCWGCAGLAWGAERPQDFALQGRIAAATEAPYLRLSLPIAVYFAARERGLADLRVFNAKGEALPYALVEPGALKETALQRNEVAAFPLRSAVPASSGALRIEVQRDAAGLVVAVEEAQEGASEGPLRGYLVDSGSAVGQRTQLDVALAPNVSGFHRLDIEASEDLVSWRPLLNGAVLAQFTHGEELLRRQSIELPPSTARYLRLNWREPAQAAELVSLSVHIENNRQLLPPRIWSEALPLRKQGEGEYWVQLPAVLPAERLQLLLDGKNLLAPVTISERQHDKQAWRSLTRAVVYQLVAQGQEWKSPDIELWGGNLSQLRFQFDTRSGGLGATPPMLSLGLRPRQLVFLAREPGPYTLAVGKNGLAPAHLPVHTLVPAYGSVAAPPVAEAELQLGEAAPATAQQGAESAAPSPLRRALLWAVLLAAVLALAAMALSLLRKTRQGAEDGGARDH